VSCKVTINWYVPFVFQ